MHKINPTATSAAESASPISRFEISLNALMRLGNVVVNSPMKEA
jgi:hypothetical protein